MLIVHDQFDWVRPSDDNRQDHRYIHDYYHDYQFDLIRRLGPSAFAHFPSLVALQVPIKPN